MGANEKHDATYHGGQYTPTANDIREVWGGFSEYGGLVIRPSGTATFLDDRYAEFDRWLETVRAEAKAEALNEAAHALDSATINIEMLNGDSDLKQAWAFRNGERKSIIQSLRAHANRY